MREVDEIRNRYSRRRRAHVDIIYSPFLASIYMPLQERERALIRWINRFGIAPVAHKRLIEIGCGTGGICFISFS
jgi:hypothetical protein